MRIVFRLLPFLMVSFLRALGRVANEVAMANVIPARNKDNRDVAQEEGQKLDCLIVVMLGFVCCKMMNNANNGES